MLEDTILHCVDNIIIPGIYIRQYRNLVEILRVLKWIKNEFPKKMYIDT